VSRIRYYTDFAQDMVTSPEARELPSDYQWLPQTTAQRVGDRLIATVCRWVGRAVIAPVWHYHVVGLAKLRQAPQGIFLYANHTQPVGDAFMPLVLGGRRQTYVIAAPSNLSVPVMGKLVPRGGGLVLPSTRRQLVQFNQVVATVIAAGAMVTVYPEAHVWPYATQIRPFVPGAFHYPVATQAPVFVQTNVYTRRHGRPRITAYIDGPIVPDQHLSQPAQRRQLAAAVAAQMQQRAALSDASYIEYRRKEE
jgi:1-acyl-sn-glycerol-3-phosphate acyltransferase